MNLPEAPAGLQAFVETFFGPGNDLRWEKITQEGSSLAPHLEPWLRNLFQDPDQPTMLPRLRGGVLEWYGLSRTRKQRDALREELLAFVGPTLSSYRGGMGSFASDDEIDSTVLAQFGTCALKLRVTVFAQKNWIRNSLESMRRLCLARPRRRVEEIRPTGRILRDFELALGDLNETAAESYLDELRSGGRLSAANLCFLQVRFLAVLRRWEDLLTLPELPMLLDLRRPPLVTEALIQAVYAVELARFETESDAPGALQHFRDDVYRRFSQLFRARGAMSSPEASKCFLMHAALSAPPRTDARDTILATYPADAADGGYVHALADLVGPAPSPPTPSPNPLVEAKAAFRNCDYDGAFELLLKAPSDRERTELLIRCAYDLGTLQAAKVAVGALEACGDATRTAILASRWYRQPWEELCALAGGEAAGMALPTSWNEWLERLLSQGPWPKATEVAQQGSHEWDPETLRGDPEAVARMASLLEELASSSDDARVSALRNSLPYLVGFVFRDGVGHSALTSVYANLTIILILEGREIGSSGLELVHDLAAAQIQAGLADADYAKLISDIVEVWGEFDSAAYLDWLLEVADTLATFPRPSGTVGTDPIGRFAATALAGFQRWYRRVRPEQWSLLGAVLSDLDQSDGFQDLWGRIPVTQAEVADERARLVAPLAGKIVGIYCIKESSSRRVRDLVLSMQPEVDVRLCHDTHGSSALRNLARESDFLVLNTRCATHAATDVLRANVGRGCEILYPTGKGSGSMAAAIFNHLRELTGASG